MGEVRLTLQAQDDLIDIWMFTAEATREAADRLMDAIKEKCEMLASSPEMGKAREELAPSLRSFPSGRYIIFYRPTGNGIEVIRVLSGYRDIDALFP